MAIRSEVTLDTTKARGEARRASNEIAKSMSAAASGGGSGGGGGGGLTDGAESALTKISSAGNLLGAAIRTVQFIGTKAYTAAKGSAELGKAFDDLRGGLEQVLPVGADVAGEMTRIEELMSKPGVSWNSAIRAHTTLIALGKTADESADMIAEIGNVLKSTGDDKPGKLEEFVEALTKIDDKGAPAIKQLSALAEKTTGVRVALERAFTTSNAEKLEAMQLSSKTLQEGLVAGLKSLNRSSLDSVDLLQKDADALKLWGAKKGSEGIAMTPGRAGSAGDPVAAAAFRKELEETNAERIAGLMEAKDLEHELASAKLKEKDLQDQLDDALPTQRAELQNKLDVARENTDQLALQVEMEKELEKLKKEQNLNDEQATALLTKKVSQARELEASERAISQATKARENSKAQSDDSTQRAIDKARSTGNNRRADKLQRDADLASSTTEGLGMGLDPAAAAARAKDIQQTREDQAYRDRTGRSRIHGGGAATGMNGIDDSLSGIHRSPLGLQGRMSDASFPSLDKMAASQANRDKSRDPVAKPSDQQPQKADPELLKKMDTLIESYNNAQKRENAKPLSAA